jgi:hypothetical protein
MAALLSALAAGLIYLRTDTAQAGNRLHGLFRQKRDLERECCRLEMSIAALKSQARLRQQAADLREEDEKEVGDNNGNPGAGSARHERPRPAVATRGVRAPP